MNSVCQGQREAEVLQVTINTIGLVFHKVISHQKMGGHTLTIDGTETQCSWSEYTTGLGWETLDPF
jgi:hypothetical protein